MKIFILKTFFASLLFFFQSAVANSLWVVPLPPGFTKTKGLKSLTLLKNKYSTPFFLRSGVIPGQQGFAKSYLSCLPITPEFESKSYSRYSIKGIVNEYENLTQNSLAYNGFSVDNPNFNTKRVISKSNITTSIIEEGNYKNRSGILGNGRKAMFRILPKNQRIFVSHKKFLQQNASQIPYHSFGIELTEYQYKVEKNSITLSGTSVSGRQFVKKIGEGEVLPFLTYKETPQVRYQSKNIIHSPTIQLGFHTIVSEESGNKALYFSWEEAFKYIDTMKEPQFRG